MPTDASNKTAQDPSSGLTRTAAPALSSPANPLSDAEQERMHRLALELRCLVCQNQSIADSNSGLALDLRNQIAGQIRDGKSDANIKQYMVERYGDFVLYKPPFSMNNAALWIGPFLLLLIGFVLALRTIKRRRLASPEAKVEVETSSADASSAARLNEIEERYRRDTGK